MASPSTATPEDREFELVQKLEFRILNVANQEEKLHELLQKFLPALILKVASDHERVRTRTIKTLQGINTFIQSPLIILPVGNLLKQYKETNHAVVQHYDLHFIQHSIERIDDFERRKLIPLALPGCSALGFGSNANRFIRILFRLLLDVRIPPRGSTDDQHLREQLGLSDAKDAAYLAKLIGVFVLLRTPKDASKWHLDNPSLSQEDIACFEVPDPASLTVFSRLHETKQKLVALLASGAFADMEKYIPALYAASSYDTRVSSTGDEILKRSSISLEDDTVVAKLFRDHARLGAAYRTRILAMLARSEVSTTMSDEVVRVVDQDFQDKKENKGALDPQSSLERSKLHNALLHYLGWVSRVCQSHSKKFDKGEYLIKVMQAYIEAQGWPKPNEESGSAENVALRSRAYETIGLLAPVTDFTPGDWLDLARWLFTSLSEDTTPDAVINMDSALSSLTGSVPPNVEPKDLVPLLLERFDTDEQVAPAVRSTRHAVLKWATKCLPFSDVYGRWISILAVASGKDERSDVVEQGHKGLDPWTYHAGTDSQAALPDWTDMVRVFFQTKITATEAYTEQKDIFDTFLNCKGSRVKAYPIAVEYCKRMMFLSALKDFTLEPSWMQKLDNLVKNDLETRKQIRNYLQELPGDPVVLLLQVCLRGVFKGDDTTVAPCLRQFLDIAALVSEDSLSEITKEGFPVAELLNSSDFQIRKLAARAEGILLSHKTHTDDYVRQNLKERRETWVDHSVAQHDNMHRREGSFMAWAATMTRLRLWGRDDLALDLDLHQSYEGFLKETITTGSAPCWEASTEAMASLWSVCLGLPKDSKDNTVVQTVVETLNTAAKKGDEKAIHALGRLAVSVSRDDEFEAGASITARGVLDLLYKLYELKQVEVHFAIGGAIAAAIARWDSHSLLLEMDVGKFDQPLQWRARNDLITETLDKLFANCKATKPSLIKASGIWLFSIVQYCSHLPVMHARLREAQAAFMRLLSARDELVQETASRGLSLVYERGDEELRNALIKDLVGAFTGTGPSSSLKVEEDTELFEPGALPTGEGKSVTSYKDIVSLANEVGDQRLIYKFMSLAANANTWSTRSAFGRFGLSNILPDSDVDPKLYPKLYRYRFDPNSNVQRSMEDIWKALVKDSGAVIDAHFDAILDDLLKNILGREWRVREASCAAISDLLQGRPFAQYESRYAEVWGAAVKVMDDVKGSVRNAALKLCMGLSKTLVHQLDEGNDSAAAKAMMARALPFLLSDKGSGSSVKDVQTFATITVLDIAKKGGKALKPFIPEMVQDLLGLLSTIEPEAINYHYQRAGEDNRDKIDRLRSQMVNQSPISEAIENCLRFVDQEVMADLAPRLENTIKTAIGMPTKIGCSRVLTTLFTRHANDIEKVSRRFLHLMEKQVMDKNDEVSHAYAAASGYMVRAVSDESRIHFFNRLQEMYFTAEEEQRRQKVSDVVMAVAKASPDHFTAHQTKLLPFAYFGSHDTDEYTSKMFAKVWETHAGSTRTVARYVSEIVALVEEGLDTAQWALRHGAAFTVGAMAADVANASTASSQISLPNLKLIWPALDKALVLKTFKGKEKVLASFPPFVEKGKALWSEDAKVAAQMRKVAVREAKRNNDEYRPHALEGLWKFAEAREDLDMLEEIAGIVVPHLDELKDESDDKMDVDGREDVISKTAKNGFEAIARGYNRARMAREPETVLRQLVAALKPYLASAEFAQIKREVWYGCVKDMMGDVPASHASADGDSSLTMEVVQSLDLSRGEVGTEAHRLRRAEAALEVLRKLPLGLHKPEVEEVVREAEEAERSRDVKRLWRMCLEQLGA